MGQLQNEICVRLAELGLDACLGDDVIQYDVQQHLWYLLEFLFSGFLGEFQNYVFGYLVDIRWRHLVQNIKYVNLKSVEMRVYFLAEFIIVFQELYLTGQISRAVLCIPRPPYVWKLEYVLFGLSGEFYDLFVTVSEDVHVKVDQVVHVDAVWSLFCAVLAMVCVILRHVCEEYLLIG